MVGLAAWAFLSADRVAPLPLPVFSSLSSAERARTTMYSAHTPAGALRVMVAARPSWLRGFHSGGVRFLMALACEGEWQGRPWTCITDRPCCPFCQSSVGWRAAPWEHLFTSCAHF